MKQYTIPRTDVVSVQITTSILPVALTIICPSAEVKRRKYLGNL